MTGAKNERWKKYKNSVHEVRLIEKLQKAIMIVRMCRPLVLAAGVNRVAVPVYVVLTSLCPLVLAGPSMSSALLTYIHMKCILKCTATIYNTMVGFCLQQSCSSLLIICLVD